VRTSVQEPEASFPPLQNPDITPYSKLVQSSWLPWNLFLQVAFSKVLLTPLSYSPLVFHRVQKHWHFWHVFPCNPNLISSHECYNTYTTVQNWAVLWCGLLRKFGGWGLGFKVLNKSNIKPSNSDAFPLALECSPIVMFLYFRLHSFLPYYYSIKGKCKDGFTYVLYINGGHPPWGI